MLALSALHWEAQLLTMAQEAIESYHPDERRPQVSQQILDQAYRYCEQLTQFHSKTFYMASGLLPFEKRRAVRALYAFCRVSDDLVDCSAEDSLNKLKSWRDLTLDRTPTGEDAVALAWSDTRQNYKIPWRYAEQLLDGVAQDLRQTRYSSFEELSVYCYGVACTVGLMSMQIIGYASEEAILYAIRLGVALQMTNILRDVGDDWRNGRLYLPQDELSTYQITEDQVAAGLVDENWRSFMQFQIDRTHRLYDEALPGIALLNKDGRFAINAAAELYEAILADIKAHNYDNFHRRASVSKWGKIRRLPGIWWRAQHIQPKSRTAVPHLLA